MVASFAMFLICGGITGYGFTTFFNPIVEEFGWSAAQISFAFSLRSIEFGIMAPLVGFLMDKVGVRKVIIFGMAVSGLGFLLMSRTNSLLLFYGAFLILSIGTSCGLGMGQYVAVANWFSKKRTWVMGIMSVGYGLSGIAGPVLVWLIRQYGWRSTLVSPHHLRNTLNLQDGDTVEFTLDPRWRGGVGRYGVKVEKEAASFNEGLNRGST